MKRRSRFGAALTAIQCMSMAAAVVGSSHAFAQEDPSKACLSALQPDPKIQILNAKMPFDITNGQSLAVLSDPTKPNTKEKVALAYFATEADRCFGVGAEWRTEHYPVEVSSALTLFRVDVLSAMADLYGGKMTFGDYAKLRAKMLADLKVKVDGVVAAKNAEREEQDRRQQEAAARKDEADRLIQVQREALAQQQADAEQQRQIALQQAQQQQVDAKRRAILQMLQNQQVKPYVIPPTITTNCQAYGNSANCTTH